MPGLPVLTLKTEAEEMLLQINHTLGRNPHGYKSESSQKPLGISFGIKSTLT